jgi:hypothetical protein
MYSALAAASGAAELTMRSFNAARSGSSGKRPLWVDGFWQVCPANELQVLSSAKSLQVPPAERCR